MADKDCRIVVCKFLYKSTSRLSHWPELFEIGDDTPVLFVCIMHHIKLASPEDTCMIGLHAFCDIMRAFCTMYMPAGPLRLAG